MNPTTHPPSTARELHIVYNQLVRNLVTYRYADGLQEAADAFPQTDITDPEAARQQVIDPPIESICVADWTGVELIEDQTVQSDRSLIPLAIYRPTSVTSVLPTLIYFHGGGFVLGDERSDDHLLSLLARELDIIVVSVGYRLAPEHPCPAALNDGEAVLRWCRDNADEHQFDLGRLGLGGRSAGAAIAAGVALNARNWDSPPLAFLYLGEPVLDSRLTTFSMTHMDDTPVWRRSDAIMSWKHYCGPDTTIYQLPAHASPATYDFIDHLPPTYIGANEIDPLRDEAIDFARRLLEAGVPVELHLFPGAFHGTMSFEVRIADRARAELVDALWHGLVHPDVPLG